MHLEKNVLIETLWNVNFETQCLTDISIEY